MCPIGGVERLRHSRGSIGASDINGNRGQHEFPPSARRAETLLSDNTVPKF
jgi:hypothetical protein